MAGTASATAGAGDGAAPTGRRQAATGAGDGSRSLDRNRARLRRRCCSCASTVSSAASSSGLVTKPLAPFSRARSRSCGVSCPVHMTTGIAAVSGLAVMMPVTSYPSMSGIMKSMKMTSGAWLFRKSSASWPEPAVSTPRPRASSMRFSLNCTTLESSTISALPMFIVPPLVAGG